FVRRTGARITAGLRTPDAEPLDRWVPYVYYQHEILRYLEVAALVGARPAGTPEPRLAVTDADRAELARVLGAPPPGLVAIHPGASDPRRRWPAERFAKVADGLGRPVVVTGTRDERDVVDRVVAAMRRPARAVVDELSVGGLAALYAACDLVIANDTGPRHLAAAVGTPTVGIYWCGNLINAGPLTRARHRPPGRAGRGRPGGRRDAPPRPRGRGRAERRRARRPVRRLRPGHRERHRAPAPRRRGGHPHGRHLLVRQPHQRRAAHPGPAPAPALLDARLPGVRGQDRKSTRLNSSHVKISYAVFCL